MPVSLVAGKRMADWLEGRQMPAGMALAES
jgi:hypothetical protein